MQSNTIINIDLTDKVIQNNEINSRLMNMIADFLLLCWADYSKPSKKKNV